MTPADTADTDGERTPAVVRVDDTDGDTGTGVVLGAELARRLDAADGDTVLLTTAAGTRAATRATVESTGDAEMVRVGGDHVDRLGIADGDRVVLERRNPATATEVRVAPLAALSVRGGHEAVAEALRGQPIVRGGTVDVSLLGDTLEVPFRVLETVPEGVVVTGPETTVTVDSGPAGSADDDYGPVPSTAVGGYEPTVEACRSALVRPLTDPDAYTLGGTSAAAGVLVTGQAGVGKSHHVRHAAWLADAELVRVDATRLARSGSDADEYLDSVRTRAEGHSRALVHVPELDALADDAERAASPVVERFAAWLDRLRRRPGVVVAGETRAAAALPDALTRGGRLSRRVEVPPPDSAARAAVFDTLSQGLRFGPGVGPGEVGDRTLGYVAADLVALRARLIEAALERVGTDTDGTPVVTAADLETALAETAPSASDAAVDVPDVSFDDIGGLTEAKQELVRAVEWPLRYPDALARLGIEVPGGVLLYGPPGTGKTLLARAVASSTDANFLSVDGPELFDKFVGESERAVREVFTRARESAPAVVFFDEVDALGATRGDEGGAAPERVVSQLLTELDGLEGREGVTVLGATNRLDRVDPALLRPGRFDRTVEVGLPERAAREEILRIHARDRPLDGVDLGEVAARTEGFSGSDLAALLREASLAALEAELDEGRTPADVPDVVVRPRHIEGAFERVSTTVATRADREDTGSAPDR
jgi:transitional endoplasmic reticulum ATPase